MKQRCRHEACFADTACALGHQSRSECEHWVQSEQETPEPETAPDAADIPWNGYSLGTSDFAILAGRGQPVVVGLIGAEGSGKTTLLAFLYMWLLEHGEVPGWVFAGSWTLGAWESLVQQSRWAAEPPPAFPPHTSSSGRVPGLLHLTLRNKEGLVRDVLFTDAPGEWFTVWAKAPEHEGAAGARWVIEHSDVILLLVDSSALSNEQTLPQARRETRDITERVGALASRVPLGFTWTKTDVALSAATREPIERARSQFAPTSEIWQTTTENPSTIAKVLSQAIDFGTNQPSLQKLHEPRFDDDPFLAFRRNYVCG